MLVNNKENNQENMCDSEHLLDSIKRKLINETCNGLSNDTERVLNLHSKTYESQEQNSLLFNCSASGGNPSSCKKSGLLRHVQAAPEKILDAPDFRDDFCKSAKNGCFKVCLTKLEIIASKSPS